MSTAPPLLLRAAGAIVFVGLMNWLRVGIASLIMNLTTYQSPSVAIRLATALGVVYVLLNVHRFCLTSPVVAVYLWPRFRSAATQFVADRSSFHPVACHGPPISPEGTAHDDMDS